MKKVLLTGASGFLGSYIVKELLGKNFEVFALSRYERVSSDERLKWIVADLSDEASFDPEKMISQLEGVDLVIHAAALYDLKAGHNELYRQNVLGTSNLLHLLRQLKKKPHFAHISTIAIAGNSTSNFNESMFDVGQTFPDPYASTKFASEHIVRTANDFESRSVYRLGIVVGSTEDGKIDRIDGPYYLQSIIRLAAPVAGKLDRLRFLPFPYSERTRLYLIPVDIAAQVISELAVKVSDRKGISTFHVTGGGRGVSVRRAIQTMLAYYKVPLSPLSVPSFMMPKPLFKLLGTPINSVSYMNTKWTFSSTKLEQEMPTFRYPSFTHLSDKLMDYAEKHYFAKDKMP